MQIISKLSDMIEDELQDAEKYITCAMNYKTENPALAQTFVKISGEEMGHMSLLHEQVEAIIEAYRKEHGDPPEKMMGIYEYLHKKYMEKAREIKIMQAMFKA